MSKKRLKEMFLLHTQNLLLQAIINIKKIDHVKVIFSESSVSQIYFELTSIKKNRSSNFQGFTVYVYFQSVYDS